MQAATKLRTFFLDLLQPIRTSMTTNMQVVQTSIFLKYRSLFVFLQRHAPTVANEDQRAYVGAARTYFETGFRRYIRSLGWVKVFVFPKGSAIINPYFGRRGPQKNLSLSSIMLVKPLQRMEPTSADWLMPTLKDPTLHWHILPRRKHM